MIPVRTVRSLPRCTLRPTAAWPAFSQHNSCTHWATCQRVDSWTQRWPWGGKSPVMGSLHCNYVDSDELQCIAMIWRALAWHANQWLITSSHLWIGELTMVTNYKHIAQDLGWSWSFAPIVWAMLGCQLNNVCENPIVSIPFEFGDDGYHVYIYCHFLGMIYYWVYHIKILYNLDMIN